MAAAKSRSWYLWPVVVLAIETAMRRGEILGLRWEHIDLDKKTVFLPMTKNGSSRWVPLSDEAIAKLSKAPTGTDHPFPVTDVAFRQAWDRLRTRADITDLTFHDLRFMQQYWQKEAYDESKAEAEAFKMPPMFPSDDE